MERNKYSGNIWKLFFFMLSQRRHVITLLGIYYLTLPNAQAQQIGIFITAGAVASFLLEVPSGYLADHWGHKRTLVLAKALMILSTLSFVLADSLPWFVLGSILLNVSFAFSSGTKAAFIHNTLVALKREKEYTRISSRLGANVAIISAAFIIALPFLTEIDMVLPFKVNLAIDLVGMIFTLMLVNPPQRFTQERTLSFFNAVKKTTIKGFWPFVIFMGAIGGFMVGENTYRYPYLVSLGYPVALVGMVMGLSRVIWFALGNFAHKLEERIDMKRLVRIEMFAFPLAYLLTIIVKNPYVVGLIFSIIVGYFWARYELMNNHLLKHHIKNPNYKATALSLQGLIKNLSMAIVAFAVGFAMQASYQLGYLVFSIALFVVLLVSGRWWEKSTRA